MLIYKIGKLRYYVKSYGRKVSKGPAEGRCQSLFGWLSQDIEEQDSKETGHNDGAGTVD